MSGSLWLKPPKEGAALPAIPRPRREEAPKAPDAKEVPDTDLAPDPLDELAGRIDGFVAAAVHPDEVAALLESDGMTDDHIRLTYGRADSFALAEDLYARVERRHPAPQAPPAGPRFDGLAHCLLRGLVFVYSNFPVVAGLAALGIGVKLAVLAAGGHGGYDDSGWVLCAGLALSMTGLAAVELVMPPYWLAVDFWLRVGTALLALVLIPFASSLSPLLIVWILAAALVAQVVVELLGHEAHLEET